jgi:hypothetical protein
MWLALSALVVIMLFATVAADAKLYGTRPPSTSSLTTRASAPLCFDGACAERSEPLRKAAGTRRSGDDCSATPIFPTL